MKTVETIRRNGFIPLLVAIITIFSAILLVQNIEIEGGSQLALLKTMAISLMIFIIFGAGLITGFFRYTVIEGTWIASIMSLMFLFFLGFISGVHTDKESGIETAVGVVLIALTVIAALSFMIVRLVKDRDKSAIIHIGWLPRGGLYLALAIIPQDDGSLIVLKSSKETRLVWITPPYVEAGLAVRVGHHYSINSDGKLCNPIADIRSAHS
jgi:FlaA1/EpsC-like NDP-sugar epimerase